MIRGVEPVEDFEGAGGGAGFGLGRGGDGDLMVVELSKGIEADGGAGEVAGDVFGARGVFGEQELLCVDREGGVDPAEERIPQRGGEASGEASTRLHE